MSEEKSLDYEEMARVVHLYLDQWCDESLPYPDMCADAARKFRTAYDQLLADAEDLVEALHEISMIDDSLDGVAEGLAEHALLKWREKYGGK